MVIINGRQAPGQCKLVGEAIMLEQETLRLVMMMAMMMVMMMAMMMMVMNAGKINVTSMASKLGVILAL